MTRVGATITTNVPDAAVWADPLRVRQILRNLVSNALRHGGPTVRIEGRVHGDRLELAVIDDGPGVPAKKVDRLFTRFVHEGDEALTVGSVGLGLAVVKALADGMEGEVRYRRADGWTSFEVALPLAPAESDAPAPSAAPPASLQVAASSAASESGVSGYRLGYASPTHAHEH